MNGNSELSNMAKIRQAITHVPIKNHYLFRIHSFDQAKVLCKTNYQHSSDEPKVKKDVLL
jgi:hypothetical protein